MKIPFRSQLKAGWPFRHRALRPDHRAWCRGAALGCLLGLLLPAAAQPQQAILEPLGSLPGFGVSSGVFSDGDIEVVGTTAYVADGDAGLQIIDIANPARPVRMGGLDTPGSAAGMQVVGTTAYVANSALGLQIIDVSNPAAPVLLGTYETPGVARGVHVADGIAYVANQTFGLQVISVTNPAAPVRLGSRDTPDWAVAVQVVGNFAYVGDDTTGLMVMEVSNPAAPVLRRTMTVQGWITDLQVVSNLCLVTSREGLTLFDVSTPTSPVRRAFVSREGGYRNVSVSGQNAIVSRLSGGLEVFDVSTPAAPRQVLLEPGSQTVNSMLAVGSRLYATVGGEFRISNLRLGLAQSLSWAFQPGVDVIALNVPVDLNPSASSGLPVNVQVAGPVSLQAGVLTVTNFGRVSIELWQPGNDAYLPVSEVRQFNVPELIATRLGGFNTAGIAWSVQVVGQIAYVADGGAGLQILDVSNPAMPVRLGGFNTPGTAWDLQVVDNVAYVADDMSGLQIIDVSDPASPMRLGTFNSPGTSYGLQVVGKLAYLADGQGGVQIIDVSDPAAPVRRGGFLGNSEVYDLRVAGNLAYLATAGGRLDILDVTDPSAPALRGTLGIGGSLLDLQVEGNLAYVTSGLGIHALKIVDVSNPARPTLLGESSLPATGRGLQVVDNLAFVAAETGGLRYFEVSDPAAPKLLGTFPGPDSANGVHVLGNRAYLASGTAGLKIIELAYGQPQRIAADLPDNLTFDGRALPLASSSSSGLPVTYSVLSGPGTVVGNGLVATGLGRITVRMQQPGGAGYLPVTLDHTVNIGLPELRAKSEADAVDVTWSAGLNGLFLDGRESMAAEHPWRPVAVPWQAANGQIRVPVEASPFQFFRLRGDSGQAEPLALTGWNRDVVLENALPSRALAFSSYGAAWFESGIGGHLDGLPTNRTFFSRVTPEVLFQFQPYTGSNTLWLNATRRTNSLVLATPSAYSRLYVLAHSAGGGANGTLRIHYADGSSSTPVPFYAPDWWDGSPATPTRRPAIQSLAWSITVASFTYNQVPPGFSLHQTDIDLSAGPNAGKVITRLEFVKGAAPETTGIFAVSGIAIPPTQ